MTGASTSPGGNGAAMPCPPPVEREPDHDILESCDLVNPVHAVEGIVVVLVLVLMDWWF